MDASVLIIAVGLGSSLITIVVTKVLEIIQKRSEHKMHLKSMFFQRKLETAERIIPIWYDTAVNLENLAILFQRASVDETEMSSEWFDTYSMQYTNRLNEVNDIVHRLSDASLLYFNFDNISLPEYEPLKELYARIAQGVALRNEIDLLEEQIQMHPLNTNIASIYKDKCEQFRLCMLDVSTIMGDAKIDLLNRIQLLRDSLSRYDS